MTAPSVNMPISGEWMSGGFDIPVQQIPVEPPRVKEPSPPVPMAVVLPFIEREREQVLRLLAFLSREPLSRTLYLVPFKGLKIDDVLERGRAAFADVQVIADSEGAVSDWKKGDKVRDAAGPNSLFRQAAWFFHLNPDRSLGAWLWLEPDCVPLVPAWHELIETAYKASGKLFLGARMTFASGAEYLNGVAVYPRDAVGRAPALVTRATWTEYPEKEIAFDVAGGAEVLRQASLTDLIALPALAEPRDGAVLFHGDRDGELLQKLLSVGISESLQGGSVPKNKAFAAAQKPLLRPKGGEKHHGSNGKSKPESQTRAGRSESEPKSTGAAHVQTVEPLPTIGDQIRAGVQTLVGLATNQNRKTRILAALRKTDLLPRIAR